LFAESSSTGDDGDSYNVGDDATVGLNIGGGAAKIGSWVEALV
jgi:hypothetical protein